VVTPGYDYNDSDPTVVHDLLESQKAVDAAAKFLSGKGYPVVLRPIFVRPDASQMSEFSDDGDLEIIQRVEVKQRKDLKFESKSDFPYSSLIVDACHCYDNARPKPYAYLIFNPALTCILVVDVKQTRGSWTRVEKWDRKKNRNRAFYEVPIELVREEQLTW